MALILMLISSSLVVLVELIFYIFLIPDPFSKPRKVHLLDRQFSKAAYITAYILSLLRSPLGLVPYLVKLFIFFGLRIRYESAQSTYFREVLNMLGDFVNLGLTTALILFLVGPPTLFPPTFILYLPVGAELIRLITERIPITFSTVWQLLPHRRIARMIQFRQKSSLFCGWAARRFDRYCRYYALCDTDRTSYALNALKYLASKHEDLSNRLEYISSFRIVPLSYGLRSGRVRDVARGEVFIHRVWTNDPWLLVGMAIRRAPWMFDPRYLRRPFYYMTEANRLATLAVLEHARYSPPYAVFQFGHEIRVARLHFFYGLLRLLGADVEEKVLADGTFQFDQFIFWLQRKFGVAAITAERRPLYSDDEAIADVLCWYEAGQMLAAEEIAIQYTYPLKYVKEVLYGSLLMKSERL